MDTLNTMHQCRHVTIRYFIYDTGIPWEVETTALLGEASSAGFDEPDALMGLHQILKYLVENSHFKSDGLPVAIYKRAVYQPIVVNSCSN